MDGGTYQDYLQSVRKQEQRDRDRFMGWDSHVEEPRYSADTGEEDWLSGFLGPLNTTGTTITLDHVMAA